MNSHQRRVARRASRDRYVISDVYQGDKLVEKGCKISVAELWRVRDGLTELGRWILSQEIKRAMREGRTRKAPR